MPFLRFPEPPNPFSAVFSTVENELVVTFNLPLEGGALDAANWFLRYGNMVYTILSAEAGGEVVTLTSVPFSIQTGPNVVSYSPPPFDVKSIAGVAAEAFSDFPVGEEI